MKLWRGFWKIRIIRKTPESAVTRNERNQVLTDGIITEPDFVCDSDDGDSDGSDDTTDSVKILPVVPPTEQEILERYDNDPYLKKYIFKLLDEKLQTGGQGQEVSAGTAASAKGDAGVVCYTLGKRDNHKPGDPDFVKSPSDTTLYKPALNFKSGDVNNGVAIADSRHPEQEMVNKISNFIAGIRVQHETEAQPGPSGLSAVNENLSTTQKRADQSVIDAGKFKASIAELPGNVSFNNLQSNLAPIMTQQHGFTGQGELSLGDQQPLAMEGVGPMAHPVNFHMSPLGKSDEDFFQPMCHMESGLRQKIENGEFVDLEKLLPRDKRSTYKPEDDRLEWVFRDGGTYLAPAGNRENKINGIRKWDQAFRVYAIIYCGAHPERSKEIWQYVEIIHTAAG